MCVDRSLVVGYLIKSKIFIQRQALYVLIQRQALSLCIDVLVTFYWPPGLLAPQDAYKYSSTRCLSPFGVPRTQPVCVVRGPHNLQQSLTEMDVVPRGRWIWQAKCLFHLYIYTPTHEYIFICIHTSTYIYTYTRSYIYIHTGVRGAN